jgi:hypothetical protein
MTHSSLLERSPPVRRGLSSVRLLRRPHAAILGKLDAGLMSALITCWRLSDRLILFLILLRAPNRKLLATTTVLLALAVPAVASQ